MPDHFDLGLRRHDSSLGLLLEGVDHVNRFSNRDRIDCAVGPLGPYARSRSLGYPSRAAAGNRKYYLPDARNETLRPCRVRRVFVAKLLNHHLLRADAKRAEDRERDQV